MENASLKTALFVFLAALLFSGALFAGGADARDLAADAEQVLVIGRVSGDPQKHYPRLRAMADYLGKNLKDLGISKTSVRLAKNNREMLLDASITLGQ